MARRQAIIGVMILAAVSAACGQTSAPAEAPATTVGVPAMDPAALAALKMLQDRKETLKDFQADVSYDVTDARTDDRAGKIGTADFLNDAKSGPEFSARFTHDTTDGKATKKHEQEVVFDGRFLTLIDVRGKTYSRRDILPAGAKPGDAVSLTGPMPLPIGIRVEEVTKNFEVSVVAPAAGGDANVVVLKLVPRVEVKGTFDFKQMLITVDKKLELPTKMERTEKNGNVTTIEFTSVAVDGGKATMVDTKVPTEAGWDVDVK